LVPTLTRPLALADAVMTNVWSGPTAFLLIEKWSGPDDPEGMAAVTWELVPLVGYALAQRRGVPSCGDGVAAVQAVGCWLQYLRLVRYGPFPADSLAIPKLTDHYSLGKVCGWAGAGDNRAHFAIESLDSPMRDLASDLLNLVSELKPVAPLHLLNEQGPPPAPRASRKDGADKASVYETTGD
jgi:hypothetical protein